jgi:hypothetical protein
MSLGLVVGGFVVSMAKRKNRCIGR